MSMNHSSVCCRVCLCPTQKSSVVSDFSFCNNPAATEADENHQGSQCCFYLAYFYPPALLPKDLLFLIRIYIYLNSQLSNSSLPFWKKNVNELSILYVE